MAQTGSDFTDTFRILGQFQTSTDNTAETIEKLVAIAAPLKLLEKKEDDSPYSPAELAKIEAILKQQPQMLRMFGIDPDDARAAVEKARLRREGEESDDRTAKQKQADINETNRKHWATWLPKYKAALLQTQESKTAKDAYDAARFESMNTRANPAFILRNYLMEEAIESAERDDFTKVNELLRRSLDPFTEERQSASFAADKTKRPDSRFDICVSCSS